MSDNYEVVSSTTIHAVIGAMLVVFAVGWIVAAAWSLGGADHLAVAAIATLLLWVGVGLADIAKAIEKTGGCDCENNEDTLFHH